MFALCVGDREARADRQRGELIDRIAAGAPIRKLLFIELFGHTRLPTSNVDSMMVLRARRGRTGSK
jgi:hypothetical protein